MTLKPRQATCGEETLIKKVLVVDDEPYIRRCLEFLLKRVGGLEVITAEDGQEAVRMIEEERPCLIFLDLMLPRISGYEICQWIKSRPDFSHIYVIILSAKGKVNEISKGIQMGADEYLTKPFDPDDVLQRAREILEACPGASR